MASPFCCFWVSVLCFAALISSLALTTLSGLRGSPFLVSLSLLALSTLFLLRLAKKSDDESGRKETEADRRRRENQLGIPDLRSEVESEVESPTREVFELDWKSWNADQDRDFSFSDESNSGDEDEDVDENLIEISVPGQLVSPNEEMHRQTKFRDIFLSESMSEKQEFMEILAEIGKGVHEEENLIEIDVSMGSIKCQGFENQPPSVEDVPEIPI